MPQFWNKIHSCSVRTNCWRSKGISGLRNIRGLSFRIRDWRSKLWCRGREHKLAHIQLPILTFWSEPHTTFNEEAKVSHNFAILTYYMRTCKILCVGAMLGLQFVVICTLNQDHFDPFFLLFDLKYTHFW